MVYPVSAPTSNPMKKHVFFIAVALFFLTGCTLFKGNKEIERLKFVYDANATINYGHSFSVKTMIVYKGGKEKEITSKKELRITIKGANYKKGTIYIDGYPETLRSDTIYMSAEYIKDNKTYSLKEAIPYNYQGDLLVEFRGEKGANGANGKSRSTPIIFRDGKDGEDGYAGESGENGDDLSVNIWKDTLTGLYRIKILNLNTTKTYHYTFKDAGFGIRFDVNGGNGGDGGDGGDGSDGKDGEITEKKTKSPGDGGNGGNGGIGGIGGNGGMVYVLIHPNAKEIQSKIAVYNFGGNGGLAGEGGKAGNAGKPAEGQGDANSGLDGAPGAIGEVGLQGAPFQITVEDFDIEY